MIHAAVACVAVAVGSACGIVRANAQAPGEADSNIAMGQRLRGIYRSTDWQRDPNKTAERAAYYDRLLREHTLPPADELAVQQQLATEQLRTGDVEAALKALDRAFLLAEQLHLPAQPMRDLLHLRAIAFLRLGETENCLAMHGQHSCIFPIRAAGVHTLPRGAQGAIRDLTTLLQSDPKDDLARWLLNVANMQLGQYPAGVPKAYLLPPRLFASDEPMPEWTDMAALAGIDLTTRSGGAVIEDFDGDGLLDVVTSTSNPLGAMHLFHNNGDGTFTDRTKAAGLSDELGGLNLIVADYDNDGHPDLLVLRGAWWGHFGEYPFSLLHNRGDGTFEDVTVKSGLLSFGPTQTAAFADFDNDGRLDLLVGHENNPGAKEHFPTQLFHQNADGTFTDVARQAGLAEQGFVKGVAWGDYNNDGRPDIYVSVREGENRLYRNDGGSDAAHWTFTDVTRQAGLGNAHHTFATWFFDFDNDGWPDIFTAGYSAGSMQDVGHFEAGHTADAEMPHLYRNNHDGTFTDVAPALHLDRAMLTMGANFGDLDNDGWLDVYLGTGEPSYEALLPNRVFRNVGGKRFDDVTTATGLGHLQKGHSIAFADIENRGVEDIFEEMGGAFPGDPYQSALYRNPLPDPGPSTNHSITLRLQGTLANRSAFGTRIELLLTDRDANGKPIHRHVFRTIGSVSSFGGNPILQHIGVGKATTVDEVRLRWPGNYSHEQVFHALPADAAYTLVEADPIAHPLPQKRFHLGDRLAPEPHHHMTGQ